MDTGKRRTRCWETGVELPFSRAFGLDLQLALREYEALAAKVFFLGKLLNDLGQPAGTDPRATELGLPKYVRRVVSEVMANAHMASVGIPGLFKPLPELITERRMRWVERVQTVPELGEHIASMEDTEKRDFANIAAQIRRHFDRAIYKDAVKIHLDAHLALLHRDCREEPVPTWLAGVDLKGIMECLDVPPNEIDVILAGISCAVPDEEQEDVEGSTGGSEEEVEQ